MRVSPGAVHVTELAELYSETMPKMSKMPKADNYPQKVWPDIYPERASSSHRGTEVTEILKSKSE